MYLLISKTSLLQTDLGVKSLQHFLNLWKEFVKGSGSVALLVIEASPVPAGAVKAGGYEQDDQQSDEQADAQDGGHNSPDERPLGHVDQRRPEGHADPPRSPAVLGRIARQIYPLHLQRANQTGSLVTQLVEGVFAMVTTHATLTWRGSRAQVESGLSNRIRLIFQIFQFHFPDRT